MKRMMALTAAAAVMWVAQAGWAGTLALKMESSPSDLSNLTLGQTFTVNVLLEGLVAGEELASLTGSVLFPDGLLGTPISVTPGAIVPVPGEFQSLALPGLADGQLVFTIASPTTPITSNGVFFSFDVTTQAYGAGVIEFDAWALSAELYPLDPIAGLELRDVEAGPALDFNIPGTVIPLPSAAWAGLALLGGLGGLRVTKGRRAQAE